MTTVATAAGGRNKDQIITGERRRGENSVVVQNHTFISRIT
jgi:hypothetical protein